MDLDCWINELSDSSDSGSEFEATENLFIKSERSESIKSERYKPEPSEEELSKVCYKYVTQNKIKYGIIFRFARLENTSNKTIRTISKVIQKDPIEMVVMKMLKQFHQLLKLICLCL